MSAARASSIGTWFKDKNEEEGMVEDHAYLWKRLIGIASDHNYSRATVLDYGCNRGGFLKTLFDTRPFKYGVGVDVAEASLAEAVRQYRDQPFDFIPPDHLGQYRAAIDIAFSHEVLYLLPDLEAHARNIAGVLKEGSVYYAAIGCHTGNPLWPRWRTLIAETTNLTVFDYSLDDYAQAFWQSGFRVEMRPFRLDDFVLIKPDNPYFPEAADSLDYHTHVKTVIRATRTEG